MNRHKYLKQPSGKKHYNCRLSVSEVREILALSRFFSASDISKAYGTSISTVHFIRCGYRWKSVTKVARKFTHFKRKSGNKLSSVKAKNIRKFYKLGHSQNRLARKYKVSQPVIFDIVHGRTHV